MPTNVPPDYFKAEDEFRKAKTPEDKLAALEKMMAIMPKHKGTEKLQADLKRRMAKLRAGEGKTATARRGGVFHVPHEGAAQVILVGAPNAGKSALIVRLTRAELQVAPYPFTTRSLQQGMMPFENIQIQLVDTPAISGEFMESWLPGVVRNADYALAVANLAGPNVLEELETVIQRLQEGKVDLVQEAESKLLPEGGARVRAMIVGTHLDRPEAGANRDALSELYADRFPMHFLSVESGAGVEEFREKVFQELRIIRVYTKAPGKPADRSNPVILPRGSILLDFARSIHKDFAENLKFARIWAKDKYEGQRIPRDHRLEDEDVIEMHL